jgi:flagellar basal-body rod modification protein FlgD
MIDPTQLINSDASSPGVTSGTKKDDLGQDAFLKLMVTQLKNQDPFKPTDPSAFLGQLAQFSTVTGIEGMKDSIASLSDSLRSSQVLGGTTLVGHDVLSVSKTAALGATGGVGGAVEIPTGASAAVVAVTDSSGALVRRMQLATTAGTADFKWDGTTDAGARAAAGTYTLTALANVGGANQQLETQLTSRVNSVTIDPTTSALTLNTDIGSIALANVRRVM